MAGSVFFSAIDVDLRTCADLLQCFLKKFALLFRKIGGKISVPIVGDRFDLRMDIEHFLSWKDLGDALVRFALTAGNVTVIFQIRKRARYGAFVDADMPGKLFLRDAGMLADRKDINVMTWRDLGIGKPVSTVHSGTSADDVDASHDGWHGVFFLSFLLVATATVAFATIIIVQSFPFVKG